MTLNRFLLIISSLILICTTSSFAMKKTEDKDLSITPFFKGTQFAWGMSFLPDGQLLVTEKPGKLLLISKEGRKSLSKIRPKFSSAAP